MNLDFQKLDTEDGLTIWCSHENKYEIELEVNCLNSAQPDKKCLSFLLKSLEKIQILEDQSIRLLKDTTNLNRTKWQMTGVCALETRTGVSLELNFSNSDDIYALWCTSYRDSNLDQPEKLIRYKL